MIYIMIFFLPNFIKNKEIGSEEAVNARFSNNCFKKKNLETIILLYIAIRKVIDNRNIEVAEIVVVSCFF